ncbi:hypothetical protein ACMZOO_11060 [Catenovulum sp. SX2]|uniref:hypothetical protein n=1 Tax=Catenovulum sp. SX2 TaxID=3398614 RepID=UPI003F863905
MRINNAENTAENKPQNFWVSSVQWHLVLAIVIGYNLEYFLPDQHIQQQRIEAIEYTRQAYRQSIADKVAEMRELESLLTQMDQLQNPGLATERDEEQASDTSDFEQMTAQELYQESEQVLAAIKQQQQQVVEEKLANLAGEQESQSSATATQTDDPAKTAATNNQQLDTQQGLSDEQLLAKVEQNQQQAREIFQQLTADAQRQQAGNSAALAGNQQTDNQYAFALQQLIDKVGYAYRFDNQPKANDALQHTGPKIHIDQTQPLGRKLVKSAMNASNTSPWLRLDTWYVIGPFDNKKREQIDTQFPPEHKVDLGAIYLGKDQRPLKWQYQQYDDVFIIPIGLDEYEIYYAYTTIKSDVAREVWLAIGTDDQSKIWLNEQKIWSSEYHHKPWRIDEAYLKVQLKAGENTLLLRLENGEYIGGFSIAMAAVN